MQRELHTGKIQVLAPQWGYLIKKAYQHTKQGREKKKADTVLSISPNEGLKLVN